MPSWERSRHDVVELSNSIAVRLVIRIRFLTAKTAETAKRRDI